MRRPTGAYARLVKACLRRGRTLEDAEDLVQEAYARLVEYQRSAKVRDEEAFLRRVVGNLAINQFHREQILSFAQETIEQLDRKALLVDSSPGVERILSAQQQLEQIAAMLGAVSRRTSEVFLAHRAGYRYEEVASELGISTRTVKKHIARAISMLASAAEDPSGGLAKVDDPG
ncbi:MAG: RNA polymerase sigma factor [Steroidobacteraceae bacterium]